MEMIIPLVVLILSIICHEVAHGFVAYMHGDETANAAGRLTLNPIPHIDLVGSIIVPFLSVMFTSYTVGWAKPVPYNPHNLKGKYAEAWVSAAGVLTNFFIALLAIVIYKLLWSGAPLNDMPQNVLFLVIWINISLGLFNLIPVPPFDGMSILQSLFPRMRSFTHAFTYSPLYMIAVIIVASSVFSFAAPYIFAGILTILS